MKITEVVQHYGKRCTYEKLLVVGSTDFNGYRWEGTIPWETKVDTWVALETRITGSFITQMEGEEIRNIKIIEENEEGVHN